VLPATTIILSLMFVVAVKPILQLEQQQQQQQQS
jgi:hypothetical protein